jgi:hypothetical protein
MLGAVEDQGRLQKKFCGPLLSLTGSDEQWATSRPSAIRLTFGRFLTAGAADLLAMMAPLHLPVRKEHWMTSISGFAKSQQVLPVSLSAVIGANAHVGVRQVRLWDGNTN